MAQDERPDTSPTDDVTYDKAALEEAKKGMHAGGTGGGHDDDPPGGHDPDALHEGAERMGVERD